MSDLMTRKRLLPKLKLSDCRKFTKTQWRTLRVITEPDTMRAQVRADEDGSMWLWQHANGKHVWAKRPPG